MFEAITGRDYIVIQGVTLVIAIVYLVVNLVVDVSYALPRPADPARLTSAATERGRRRRRADAVAWPPRSPSAGRRASGATRSRNVLRQRSARRRRSTILGVPAVLVAIFAAVIAPYDPNDPMAIDQGLEPAPARTRRASTSSGCPADQPQHLFGLDGNVRDVFSRVVYGARVSLLDRLR